MLEISFIMKPTNNSNDLTTKSSLSKSLKKSSKSRSKTSKSSTQALTVLQSNCREASVSAGTSDSSKSHHRSYAGFGPKTCKVLWEQHDTSETEVSQDVYVKLSEDLSYRTWELVNNIKNFARHSGGYVTCDLVNEVLKDTNTPPILGAYDGDWDKIDYYGSFYFPNDEILELRDEYLKDVDNTSVPITHVKSSWMVDRRMGKSLIEFNASLCNSIFTGEDESFSYALDVAAFAPQIGSVARLLLRKCIEILAFEQKNETTERCLKFLRAISLNIHSRDTDCQDNLFHLSELMICLLLGTFESIKTVKLERKEESFEMVKSFLESSDQDIKKEVEGFNQMDVDDIRNEYEALFQMMERDGFQERDNIETNDIVQETKITPSIAQEKIVLEVKNDQEEEVEEVKCNEVSDSSEKLQEPVKYEFSPYKTQVCDIELVDLLCSTIGHMGGQFGYFQNECTFLIQRRLEKFFDNRTLLEQADFEYLSRSIRGLVSLGEYAFRELIPFLHKINSLHAPEWIHNHISLSAIFLRGRDDIFLYEWLEDMCGDKLQPFLLHFNKYSQALTTKRYKSMRKSTFSIHSKLALKILPKRSSQPCTLQSAFPEVAPLLKPLKKIGFRFAGCCPVVLKPKYVKKDITLKQMPLTNFHMQTIIARRKLLKPLSDKKKTVNLSNFSFLQI